MVRYRGLTLASVLVAIVLGCLAGQADAFVYWTDQNGTMVGRANLDGTGANQSLISTSNSPLGVAVDGQHIYWSEPTAGAIGRANLDGSGIDESFITGASTPGGIAVDGQHIYWANAQGNSIGRAKLDGTGVNQDFISGLPDLDGPEGVAVDGQHIYWTEGGADAIGRADLDGTGASSTFITGVPDPFGIAVDSQHIYWISALQQHISRANLDGSGVVSNFIVMTSFPTGVAVDGQHIYWTNDSANTIGRANLDGTDGNQGFITAENTPGGVAVDAVAPPTASITRPTSGATFAVGQTVDSSFGCREGSGGPGLSSCLDQNGDPSGTSLDTATLGEHALTVTATSKDGATGTSSVNYTVAAAPSVSITTPASGATFAVGQSVNSSFRCSEGADGPGLATCLDQDGNPSGSALSTSALGEHTLTVTVTSTDGQTATASTTYTVAAKPSVSIAAPVSGALFSVGQAVNSSFTCNEGADGPGIASCLDQNGHSSGTAIDTSAPGKHTLTVTATSTDGQTASASTPYMVVGKPSALITIPADDGTFTVGQVVKSSFACSEGVDGPGLASCLDQDGHSSGSALDTSTSGEHTLTVTATSTDGQKGTASVSYTVATAPGPGAGGGPGPGSGHAPVLARLRQSHARWRTGSALAQISRKASRAPVGTTFSFTLDSAATVKLAFSARRHGRSVKVKGKRKCIARSKHNPKASNCTRTLFAGSVSLRAPSGSDQITFAGRVGSTGKLKPGDYAVTVTAADANGSSKPHSLKFTIVK